MDLTQIRNFLALAKALNFTRAAEACGVTQPALTKSIARLEAELGGPLLLRERSRTQLTALGAAMLPLLQQAFDAAEAARASALHFRDSERQHLRLGVGAGVEPGVASPLIREVCRRFARLELTVRGGESAALNAWLLESEVDVVLTMCPAALTERAHRWVVFADPVVAVVPNDGRPVGPLDAAALAGETLVGRQDEAARLVEDHYRLGGAIRHRGATQELVHALVRAGVGIGLSTARRQTGDLLQRAVTPPHALDVCVAAIAGRPLSRAADAFLRLARARDWTDP